MTAEETRFNWHSLLGKELVEIIQRPNGTLVFCFQGGTTVIRLAVKKELPKQILTGAVVNSVDFDPEGAVNIVTDHGQIKVLEADIFFGINNWQEFKVETPKSQKEKEGEDWECGGGGECPSLQRLNPFDLPPRSC
jgi:hypothetical protein